MPKNAGTIDFIIRLLIIIDFHDNHNIFKPIVSREILWCHGQMKLSISFFLLILLIVFKLGFFLLRTKAGAFFVIPCKKFKYSWIDSIWGSLGIDKIKLRQK